MSTGTTVQVIGAVVDVEFPAGQIPKIYDALLIDDAEIMLEVQQQLGDGVVRTIAMGSSEGLKRGMDVTNTGSPITVPVGEKTLGRIMDVLGKPIEAAFRVLFVIPGVAGPGTVKARQATSRAVGRVGPLRQ